MLIYCFLVLRVFGQHDDIKIEKTCHDFIINTGYKNHHNLVRVSHVCQHSSSNVLLNIDLLSMFGAYYVEIKSSIVKHHVLLIIIKIS